MPALAKLFQVECARCREAGHRCQAQIVVEEIALCLRCADNEPCIYVTATALAPVEINTDPCVIPEPTSEDRKAIREMPRLPSVHATAGSVAGRIKLDPATRDAIIRDGKKLSAAQLADKYHLPKKVIQNVKYDHRRKLREEYRQRALDRILTPVERKIGAETIMIAPAAVFGAEMLEARQDEPRPRKR
jgi:hypothetical protein